ncbi:hypothetical protein SAMN05216573_10780 [Bradyrhizobium sp. Rc3b]|nr:hypothetical protein SAMN05216573_10780 [Bradyrhizobium sp. Rc3b]
MSSSTKMILEPCGLNDRHSLDNMKCTVGRFAPGN